MKTIIMLSVLAFAVLFQTGCTLSAEAGGQKLGTADIGGGGKKSEFKYQMECNGCDTGEHSFGDKGDYCRALLDEGLNNSCCRRNREDTYNRECK